MVYQEIEEVIPLSSKYLQVFLNIFSDKKIGTKRKISNITSLINQLKKDKSIEKEEHLADDKIKIGKDEEISIMYFFVTLLDRKITLETHINGYTTILK